LRQSAFVVQSKGVVNTPPPKGGGFELRLKARLVRLRRTQVTLKSSSGSGGSVNDHPMRSRRFPNQLPASDPNTPAKRRIAVLRHPNQMGTCSPKQCGCHVCTTAANANSMSSSPPGGDNE
jgi:hypothetical protein